MEAKLYKFNRCIYYERDGKGIYFGLENPLFNLDTFIIPWVRDDGYRGFFHWLIFRGGWYPDSKDGASS